MEHNSSSGPLKETLLRGVSTPRPRPPPLEPTRETPRETPERNQIKLKSNLVPPSQENLILLRSIALKLQSPERRLELGRPRRARCPGEGALVDCARPGALSEPPGRRGCGGNVLTPSSAVPYILTTDIPCRVWMGKEGSCVADGFVRLLSAFVGSLIFSACRRRVMMEIVATSDEIGVP